MFRLMGLTFWGTFRGPKEIWDRIHESPCGHDASRWSCWPSRPAVLGLILGLPFGNSLITQWLEPVFEESRGRSSHSEQPSLRSCSASTAC